MPTSRRVRAYSALALVLFFGFLYFSRSTGQSDRSFYEKSVEGMKRTRASATKPTHYRYPSPSPEYPKPMPDVEGAADSANDAVYGAGRQPPQVALGDDSDSKRVKGAEGWRTGKDEGRAKVKEEKTSEERKVEAELNSILKRSPIIIFSKTYCPFSQKAKHIFGLYAITPAPFIVELDKHELGAELQAQLLKLTGRRTVPNVLISGTTIGGGDDVESLHEKGDLLKKVKEMAGKRIVEARLKGVKEKN